MDFDFDSLSAKERYKLLVALVVPRPIALVTSLSAAGVVNAAPFSFFNVLGDDPPIVILSVDQRTPGSFKDTAGNIQTAREFVVNLVDEAIAEKMHACSQNFPPQVSEIEAVGFTTSPSRTVAPPRITEAPVALECRLHSVIDLHTRHLFIGRIHWLHVRDGIVDPATRRVNMDRYFPVGRLYANRYCRTRDQFALEMNEYLQSLSKFGRV